MDTLEEMLRMLNISYPARRVYLDLFEHGESPARMIAQRLSMTRPSVYDQVKLLSGASLIGEREKDGKTVFAIQDTDDLPRLLEEKIEQMTKMKAGYEKERNRLKKKTQSVEPKIKFFEGKEGLRRLYRDLLWESDTLIETAWPHAKMASVLGEEEIVAFNKKRIKHHIRIRAIWPSGMKPGRTELWKEGDLGVDRRIAPKGFAWSMQYSIYGNRVAFMSSEVELFGFIVASREFAELMRMQFRALWMLSK